MLMSQLSSICSIPFFEEIQSWLGFISSILGVITVFIGIPVACKGLCEYKRSNYIIRANYIEKLIDRLKTDKEITDLIYKFQYDQFKYDENFHGKEIEKNVDRMLHYFSYLCYLKDKKILKDEEFGCFEIIIKETLESKDLRAYLYHLYHQKKRLQRNNEANKNDNCLSKIKELVNKINIFYKKDKYPFNHLIIFGKEINVIEKDFTTNDNIKEYKDYEDIFVKGYENVRSKQSKQGRRKQ